MNRFLAVLFLGVGLTGCAHISGRVSTVTYTLPLANSTFAIYSDSMPTISEQKVQRLIVDRMSSLGYKQTDDIATADYVVMYSYNIGGGEAHTDVSSSPDVVFGGHRVSSSSYTLYPRYFQIGIVDKRASEQSKKIIFAFQGEVYSKGSSYNIGRVAGYFLDQIFMNYGQSVNEKYFIVPFE